MLFVLFILAVYLLFAGIIGRKLKVIEWEIQLVQAIHEKNIREIDAGDGSTWRLRWEWFEAQTKAQHWRSVLCFWRDLDATLVPFEEWLELRKAGRV